VTRPLSYTQWVVHPTATISLRRAGCPAMLDVPIPCWRSNWTVSSRGRAGGQGEALTYTCVAGFAAWCRKQKGLPGMTEHVDSGAGQLAPQGHDDGDAADRRTYAGHLEDLTRRLSVIRDQAAKTAWPNGPAALGNPNEPSIAVWKSADRGSDTLLSHASRSCGSMLDNHSPHHLLLPRA